MKKNIFLFSSMLFLAFLFLKCQPNQVIKDYTVDFHINKDNPYDYVGSLHNQALDYFITFHKQEYETSVEEVFQLSKEFCISKNFDAKSVANVTNQTFINFWKEFEQSNDENKYLLDKGYVSQNGYIFLKHIDNTFEQISYYDTQDGISKIKQLEEMLIQNQVKIPHYEKEIFLSALAVGRYSLIYWAKELNEASSRWYKPKSNQVARVEAGGSDIVREDVKGAVGGGLAGALIGGTASLGTLTVPSWVAGAVVTGAVSSVAEAAAQLWDSLW